jgi:hypothetical protein
MPWPNPFATSGLLQVGVVVASASGLVGDAIVDLMTALS